jgi:hypothetical protein
MLRYVDIKSRNWRYVHHEHGISCEHHLWIVHVHGTDIQYPVVSKSMNITSHQIAKSNATKSQKMISRLWAQLQNIRIHDILYQFNWFKLFVVCQC